LNLDKRKSGFRWKPRKLLYELYHPLAFVWRRMLFRTTFIAVTGSLGKTTAKECLAAILSTAQPTFKTHLNQNDRFGVPRNILRIRPWHRFAVLELGIGGPNKMKRLARLARPDAAVILNVRTTHSTAFSGPEERAEAKAELLRWLKPGGVAVLNGDDPLVTPMADGRGLSVLKFGTSPALDVWADRVHAPWPGRLEFRAHLGSESRMVRTRLVGSHWLTSVLAAITTASFFGLDLERSAAALEKVEPFPGRMRPEKLSSGAVILRDDYNANMDALEVSLQVLGEASASRRLLVITDFSDFGKNRQNRLRYLAPRAAGAAEVLVLIGQHSEYGRRRAIEAGMASEDVHAFRGLEETADFLKGELKDGDLALLKGRTTDHASRIYFALLGRIECWEEKCPRTLLCDHCPELGFHPRFPRETVPVGNSG
jgi:UDP-N-acetylmuramoyl-tripeptide--D-alanyl-D-alanine ligase